MEPSSSPLLPPPPPPPAPARSAQKLLTKPELTELVDVHQKLKNMGKTSTSKTKSLQTLNPDLAKNKLLVTPAEAASLEVNSRSKGTQLNDLVASVEPVPAISTEQQQQNPDSGTTGGVGFQVMPIRSNAVAAALRAANSNAETLRPDEREARDLAALGDITDTAAVAILESVYNVGIPVMRRLGGTIHDFYQQFEASRKTLMGRVARGEIMPDGSDPAQALRQKNAESMTPTELRDAILDRDDPAAAAASGASSTVQLAKNKGKRKAPSGGVAAPTSAAAAKKAAATNNSIPSKFMKRYQSGALPLYAQSSEALANVAAAAGTGATGQQQQQQQQQGAAGPSPHTTTVPGGGGHTLDFGTRYLELRIPSYRSPDFAFKYYMALYVKGVDDKLQEYLTGDLRVKEPSLVRWADIQNYAFLEAKNEEDACVLGLGCVGRQLHHPMGSFTFRKWREPERRGLKHRPKKDPCLCYGDILLFLNLLKDYERRTGRYSAELESPFKYLIDVPGEYNRSAFRQCIEGNNEGATRPIRHLVMSQLQPAQPLRDSKDVPCRRFVERVALQCRDCSRKISQMPAVNPSSYINFEIGTLTNERIILLFLFRDMANRYRDTAHRELPDRTKIYRLAFVPFDDGLKLLDDEKFRAEYLPADFMTSADYILKHFDIIALPELAKRNVIRPPLMGHSIYWLLHIRLNAALNLIQTDLDMLKTSLVSSSASAAATAATSSLPSKPHSVDATAAKDQTSASTRLPASARVPDGSSSAENRVWISSSTLSEALATELEGIREKLVEYVRSHESLVEYIQKQLKEGGMIHDDAILSLKTEDERDLWLSIKPKSNYLGPYFPEDRRYIEYIQTPHVALATPPGQLAHFYLTKWCVGVESEQQQQQQILLGNLITEPNDKIAWSTALTPTLTYGPQDDSLQTLLYFAFPPRASDGKRNVIDLQLIFGDFRGLVWWMQHEADPDMLASMYEDCGGFESFGWKYKAHPAAERALAQGTWRVGSDGTENTSYVLLMSLLVAVHCSSVLMHDLDQLYQLRMARFGEKLGVVQTERSEMYSRVVSESPSDLLRYEPPKEAIPQRRERLYQLDESMRHLRECIYQIHKFSNSHLPLAYAMLTCCSNEKGAGPSDAALKSVDRPYHSAASTKAAAAAAAASAQTGSVAAALGDPTAVSVGSTVPSLYELYYPYAGAQVMCEDQLVDCSARESYVKFISDASNKEPLLDGQQKAMPVRCHTRDYGKKTDRIVFSNAAYSRYCVLNLYCSLLGGYRHCKVRPCFERCLEAYSAFHDLDRVDLSAMNAFFREHKFIALNTLRENTVFHIRNNAAFHQAVIMSFDGYRAFEDKWLQECMDAFRGMFNRGIKMQAIDSQICQVYGTNTPFVYRRLKTDYLKFIWNRLKDVLCKRLVTAFMDKDQFVWPDVLSLTRESVQYLIRIVKEIDPESDAYDYEPTLRSLGCRESSTQLIKSIEATFIREGQTPNVEALLEALSEEEHLIVFAFFHLLRSRSSIRTMNLTREETEGQLNAIARRAGVGPEDPFPVSSALIHFCSISGCNKRKTPVVQERGNRYFGNSDVSWDYETKAPVCKPKKPPKPAALHGSGPKKPRKKKKTKTKERQEGGRDGDDDDDEDDHVHDNDHDDNAEDENEDGEESASGKHDDDDDGDENQEISSKSLPVSLREFHSKLAQIREKRNSSKTPSAADKAKLDSWGAKLDELRETVHGAAKKEANRFVRRIFDLPCEDAPLDSFCTVGKVVERSFIKEKTEVECYTHCPSCGCATVFRTDMFYANGFTCGVCDSVLREDIHRPCCLGCNRLYPSKDAERKKKRGTKSSKQRHQKQQQQQNPDLDPSLLEPKAYAELMDKAKEARDWIQSIPAEQTQEMESQIEDARKLIAKAELVVQSRADLLKSQEALNSRNVTAAADKRGSKRRKNQTPEQQQQQQQQNQTQMSQAGKASSSAQEDRILYQNRTNRSARSLAVEEWYSYTLLDKNLYERTMVHVCGVCNFDRASWWLRTLEPYCTVQEFLYLLRRRVASLEEAVRLLNLGSHASAPIERTPEQEAYLNQMLALPKVPEPVAPKAVSRLGQKIRDQNRKIREAMPKKRENIQPQKEQQQ